ncbi:unnamed protein product [Symbiodinium sp. CCMP2592]|nr:unnamed protein product [Symbiodinium sp. CCMP2592]
MRYPTRVYRGSSVRVELDIIMTVTTWDRTVEGECSHMAPPAFDVGDLISSGVVLSAAPHGVLLKLPSQEAPALLPNQVARDELEVGQEVQNLLVACLYSDARSASVVVPETVAEEVVAAADAQGGAERSEQVASESSSSLTVRGRWGRSKEQPGAEKTPAEDPDERQDGDGDCRLMPFLVGSRAAETTYSSVAQRPVGAPNAGGSGPAVAWPRKHPGLGPEQESEGPSYSKLQLLQLRPSILDGNDLEDAASVPTSMPCQQEEVDERMLHMVIRHHQLPVWWARCCKEAKLQAFRVACRIGRLRLSKQLHTDALNVEIDAAVVSETLQEMCLDMQSAAGARAATKKKRSWWPKNSSSGELMSAVEAQAIAAWTSSSLSFATVPAASVAAWLLELGGPVGLLLPESPGEEALSARLRGLRLLGELGPSHSIPDSCTMLASIAGCLRDPEARGRKAAAEALGNFGPAAAESPRAVPRLLRLVKQDCDVSVREAAARALGCLGRDGLEAILEDGGLEHKDWEVRGCAVLAVGWSGVAGRDCVDRLVSLLRDDSSHPDKQSDEQLLLRIRVAQALGARAELAGDTGLLALANSLRSDPAELVREACASSIGQIGRADKGLTKLARESLSYGANDEATFVQEAARAALDTLPQLGKEDFDMPQSAWQ